MITSLDHIHIYAADPSATIDFYVRVLGGEHLGLLGDKNNLLILGGQYLVVSEFPEGMKATQPPDAADGALRTGYGVAHFGLQTTDLRGSIERLRAAGIEVHEAPRDSGPVRYVYFTAPDGVVIELVELQLPLKLRALTPMLNGVYKAIHTTRRALAKQLLRS